MPLIWDDDKLFGVTPFERAILKAVEVFVNAAEKAADALTIIATIHSERFDKEYPPERPKRAAEITREGDDKKAQYSDRPDKEWLDGAEAAASRFQERFTDSKKSVRTETKAATGTGTPKDKA